MNRPEMQRPGGLVLGFEAFAGMPSNPAEALLPAIDGMTAGGFPVVAKRMPVSLARLPGYLSEVLAEHRPAFVMGMGVALGSPVIRVETTAINVAHFGIADNDGARPVGEPFDPGGPAARRATWDARKVTAAIMEAGVPARISHHAGTHCCNLALHTCLGLLERLGLASPCGFLHLPYLPEQVVWLMRKRAEEAETTAPASSPDLPSMSFDLQATAAKAAIGVLATQAARAAERQRG